MTERIISPASAYWIGFVMHLFFLVIASSMFKMASDGRQVIPMIIFGLPFIIVLIIFGVFLNRQVHIRIIDDEKADCRSLLRQVIVPLSDISDIRKVWFNTYRFKISGKNYLFFGFRQEANSFKKLVDGLRLQ